MVIKPSDYFEFKGIDLNIQLKSRGTDNPTLAAQIYIDNIKNFLLDYVNENFEAQKYKQSNEQDEIKRAVLHQIAYFEENGDLSIHNPNNLPLLAPNAYRILKVAGLANLRSR